MRKIELSLVTCTRKGPATAFKTLLHHAASQDNSESIMRRIRELEATNTMQNTINQFDATAPDS